RDLERRRPGAGGAAATTRGEADRPEFLSGVFEGHTLGTPIAILVRNGDQRSADYDELRELYRPGHADWTWEAKYGRRDHRGGGRSSGRETAGRVAAGAVARTLLLRYGIGIRAWSASIAGIASPEPGDPGFDPDEAEQNPLRVPSGETAERIARRLEEIRAGGDSAGGIIACRVTGMPPGLGEPVFDKLPALLGRGILSIGACRGVEFGAGFAAAAMTGSEHNDAPLLPPVAHARIPAGRAPDGATPKTAGGTPKAAGGTFGTNHAGGALGGISNGMDLLFRAAFKPAASVARTQRTVDRAGGIREISVRGRHDVCIVPRAAAVVEAMTALVVADLLLLQKVR
ncbi:MAG: chorismate synthase, partial [Treponema sp.]|nr:chorismate synthase [Treponema sp.]